MGTRPGHLSSLPETCPRKDPSPQTPLTYPLPASPGLLPLPCSHGHCLPQPLPSTPDCREPLLISQLFFQIGSQPMPQSVLVLNIPDVLDGPEMHDILEIHFQKPTRGGGEVESLTFVPKGQRGLAVFTSESG